MQSRAAAGAPAARRVCPLPAAEKSASGLRQLLRPRLRSRRAAMGVRLRCTQRPRPCPQTLIFTSFNIGRCDSMSDKISFPTPVGTPGGKPQRLTARAKIARARLDRFWPGRHFSICVSDCPSVRRARATSQIWERKSARALELFAQPLECPSLLVVAV